MTEKTKKYRILRRPKDHSKEDFLVLLAPFKDDEYVDHRPESWKFSFYRIIEEEANQQDVFEDVGRPVIESVLDGYNGTVFAYGQTGSGKTYTITGKVSTSNSQGIVPRTLSYLFDVIKMHPENVYSVDVAYLEIYNEYGYDLLDRKQQQQQQQVQQAMRLEDLPRVSIQEDEKGKLRLKNLTFHNVKSEDQAMELFLIGDSRRTQLLSETVTQVFLTVSFYRLYLLLIDVGRRKITKAPSLMLKVGPCCCWPCLPFPNLDMIDSRLTWIRLIILQLPVIQGLLYFIMLIMALDEQNTLPMYSEWLQPFLVISILFALYGLTITTKSLHAVAPEAKLNFKTMVCQMVLMFSKAQAAIIKILIYTGVFPCRPPLSPKIYANVTQNTLMLIEMLLLCVAARYLYYVDPERKEDSSTTDRPKDKPHNLTNNKDLPEQVSTKIAVVFT